MPNLLRSPAVLIAILLTVYWVFGPTPTPDSKEPVSDPRQDKLVLRVPPQEEKPDPPLPLAKKQRRKGPARAAIRATEPHQLASAQSTTDTTADSADTPMHATIRGITPLPNDKASPTPVQQRELRHVTHMIVDGDDLKRLASRYLGDSERYYEIFEANPEILDRPDVLPVGEKIRIPISASK